MNIKQLAATMYVWHQSSNNLLLLLLLLFIFIIIIQWLCQSHY